MLPILKRKFWLNSMKATWRSFIFAKEITYFVEPVSTGNMSFCGSRWSEQLIVYPRTNKQNQKKKRKVEPATSQVLVISLIWNTMLLLFYCILVGVHVFRSQAQPRLQWRVLVYLMRRQFQTQVPSFGRKNWARGRLMQLLPGHKLTSQDHLHPLQVSRNVDEKF